MKTRLESFFELFGVPRMPWVIRVHLLLFLVLCGLLIFSAILAPTTANLAADHPIVKLFSIASDSLKIVMGALLGALSMAAEKQWGRTKNISKASTLPSEEGNGA